MALFRAGSASFLPHVIKARTAELLHRAIIRLQARSGAEFRFISFYYDGSNHCAWYYNDTNFEGLTQEE